jgi:DNA-binding GntR family transcriptional regulator
MVLAFSTKRQMAVSQLRDAIIRGELAPGTRLVLETLSHDYGLGLTPLREALPVLESEGLILLSPHKGAIVAPMDQDEIRELYVIRTAIEALATSEAVERLTAADLAQMAEIVDEMERFRGSWESFLDLDKRFHLILYRASGRRRWVETITSLWRRSTRYMIVSTAATGAIDAIQADHRRLLHACQDRATETAEAIIRAHLKYSEQSLLKNWQRKPVPRIRPVSARPDDAGGQK